MASRINTKETSDHNDQQIVNTICDLTGLCVRDARLVHGYAFPTPEMEEFFRILNQVQTRGWDLQYMTGRLKNKVVWSNEYLRDNPEIVQAAIWEDNNALQFASARLQKHRFQFIYNIFHFLGVKKFYLNDNLNQRSKDALILAQINQNGYMLGYASPQLKDNESVVLDAVSNNGRALQSASDRLRDNEHVVLAAVLNDCTALQFASDRLRNDEQFILSIITKSSHMLQNVGQSLRDNEQIVFAAVSNFGYMLSSASPRLQGNEKIVLAAVSNNGSALQWASDQLKDNEQIVCIAVSNYPSALYSASPRLKDNEKIVLAAVSNDGSALQWASDRLKDDEQIALAAVNNNSMALSLVSDRIKDNERIIHAAVENDFDAIQNFNKNWLLAQRLLNDERIMRAGVKKNGLNLVLASERLRDNDAIVAIAMAQNKHAWAVAKPRFQTPNAIHKAVQASAHVFVHTNLSWDQSCLIGEYAFPKTLRAEIFLNLLESVRQNGMALSTITAMLNDKELWSNAILCNNEEIVLAAISKNGMALQFASDRLKNNSDNCFGGYQSK